MNNPQRGMRYFEMFAGVGGFSLALKEHNCVGMSEIDKFASAVLAYRFPNIKNYGDCQTINWSDVPDFDLLVGGSPCQDFSVAGKRAGLDGERSGLFREFIRSLEEKKPTNFIWENVKGTLSSRSGWDFANIQVALAEAGYSLWWQVLNAKDFGVPQNRERVFIVGSRKGSPREVFFEAGSSGQHLSEITQGVSDAQRIYKTDGLAKSQKALGGGLGAKTGLYAVRQPLRYLNRNQKNIEGDYAFCVDASQTSGVKIMKRKRNEYGKKIRKDYEAGKTDARMKDIRDWCSVEQNHSNTLSGVQIDNLLEYEARIRRLTPKECMRLMSWPDDWCDYGNFDGEVKEISDSQKYRMAGNGVVSNVVAEVVKNVIN